jgi:hypothetical protein
MQFNRLKRREFITLLDARRRGRSAPARSSKDRPLVLFPASKATLDEDCETLDTSMVAMERRSVFQPASPGLHPNTISLV